MGIRRAKAQMSSEWSNKVSSKFKWLHRLIILIWFVGAFLFPFKVLTSLMQINIQDFTSIQDPLLLLTCIYGSILIVGPGIYAIDYFTKYYEKELYDNLSALLTLQLILFLIAFFGLITGWNFVIQY